MSKRYQEILPELIKSGTKKSRTTSKQLLSLIRELCFYASIANSEQWIPPLILIAKGVIDVDNDADRKTLRIIFYLVTAFLLKTKGSKGKEKLLNDAISIVRHELEAVANNNLGTACFLWRSYGSLAAATSLDEQHSTYVSSTVTKLQYPTPGKKNKGRKPELELQIWNAEFSALRRALMGTGALLAGGCIGQIFTAAGSSDVYVARHGSALLLLLALNYNKILTEQEGKEGRQALGKELLKALQSAQLEDTKSSLNLTDDLCCSNILQTISALTEKDPMSDPTALPDSLAGELYLCGVKLVHNTSPKVFADTVRYLLGGSRAKAIISSIPSSLLREKENTMLSLMCSEFLSRVSIIMESKNITDGTSSIAVRAELNATLVLPTLLRAAVCIGRYYSTSCINNIMKTDNTAMNMIWRTVLFLHDSLVESPPPGTGPHLLLQSLEALLWLTHSDQNPAGDGDEELWLSVGDRIIRAMPMLLIGSFLVIVFIYFILGSVKSISHSISRTYIIFYLCIYS
jgi:hypothetical protein